MSRAGRAAWLFPVVVLLAAAGARAAEIDAAASQVGFQLVTRWGEVVDGRFPVFEGRLSRLPDGREQVRLVLSTADVEILGSARHTHLTRGKGFFEAERYPWVVFESDPFEPGLLARGGELPGMLVIRGVSRHESFTVAPSTCSRPALDCAVSAKGVINRSLYGMSRWAMVVGRNVYFQLRIRVGDEGGGE